MYSQEGLTSLELVESGQLESLLNFSSSYGEFDHTASDALPNDGPKDVGRPDEVRLLAASG